MTGGSPERNLLALVNAIPSEKSHYDTIKNKKEEWMRARLEQRRPARYHSWHGRIPGRPDLPDVDYALIDKAAASILLLELNGSLLPLNHAKSPSEIRSCGRVSRRQRSSSTHSRTFMWPRMRSALYLAACCGGFVSEFHRLGPRAR